MSPECVSPVGGLPSKLSEVKPEMITPEVKPEEVAAAGGPKSPSILERALVKEELPNDLSSGSNDTNPVTDPVPAPTAPSSDGWGNGGDTANNVDPAAQVRPFESGPAVAHQATSENTNCDSNRPINFIQQTHFDSQAAAAASQSPVPDFGQANQENGSMSNWLR